MYTVVFVG